MISNLKSTTEVLKCLINCLISVKKYNIIFKSSNINEIQFVRKKLKFVTIIRSLLYINVRRSSKVIRKKNISQLQYLISSMHINKNNFLFFFNLLIVSSVYDHVTIYVFDSVKQNPASMNMKMLKIFTLRHFGIGFFSRLDAWCKTKWIRSSCTDSMTYNK